MFTWKLKILVSVPVSAATHNTFEKLAELLNRHHQADRGGIWSIVHQFDSFLFDGSVICIGSTAQLSFLDSPPSLSKLFLQFVYRPLPQSLVVLVVIVHVFTIVRSGCEVASYSE